MCSSPPELFVTRSFCNAQGARIVGVIGGAVYRNNSVA